MVLEECIRLDLDDCLIQAMAVSIKNIYPSIVHDRKPWEVQGR